MATEVLESNVAFTSLMEDIEKQLNRVPQLTKEEIAEKFFSEKHQLALIFDRVHRQIMSEGISGWWKNGGLQQDFDILFEYAEKGYAQGISGFDSLLSVCEYIRDLGTPSYFHYVKEMKVECYDCKGTGGTYASGKCTTCNGSGRIPDQVEISGEGEEKYAEALDLYNEVYQGLSEEKRFKSFETFIHRFDEEEVNIEKALDSRKYVKKLKPDCKLLGEDGNVFNLLGIVSRTLKRNNLNEEAEEMKERVFASHSYDEALRIFMDYVDIY